MAKSAREAAADLSRRSDGASLGVELLRDIRAIAEELSKNGVDRIRSEELTHKLGALADRPWAEMPYPYTGKQITQPQLARLLKGYRIKPKQIRFGSQTFKGYEFTRFERAFRYIPPLAFPKCRNTETNKGFRQSSRNKRRNKHTRCFGQCFGKNG
jgi:hypothetical protein